MGKIGRIALVVFNVSLILVAVGLGIGKHQEHGVRVSLEALADRLGSELANLHAELKESRAETRDTRLSLEQALSDRDQLVAKLRERDQILDRMKAELSQLKIQFQKVNLGSVTVPKAGLRQSEVETMPVPAAPAAPAIAEGAVVAVNDEFGFVIVNLGMKNGIREGQTLAVLQDGLQAGNLRVDLVEDATCAAAVMSNMSRPLKIGDLVHTTT